MSNVVPFNKPLKTLKDLKKEDVIYINVTGDDRVDSPYSMEATVKLLKGEPDSPMRQTLLYIGPFSLACFIATDVSSLIGGFRYASTVTLEPLYPIKEF